MIEGEFRLSGQRRTADKNRLEVDSWMTCTVGLSYKDSGGSVLFCGPLSSNFVRNEEAMMRR